MFFVSSVLHEIVDRSIDRLVFLVPPSIVDNGQMINELTVFKGQSLVLTCSLHAIPLPTILWTKNEQELLESDRLNLINSSSSFRNRR